MKLAIILGLVATALAVEDCGNTPIVPNPAFRNASFPLIVNGDDAKPYSWPWQVALCAAGGNVRDCRLNCGASLINSQWVVTAAHCAFSQSGSRYNPKVAVFDISNPNEDFVVLDVERQIQHPDYNSQTLENDISLLKLATPVQYTDKIQPVCLASAELEARLQEGDQLVNTGWGRLSGSGPIAEKLQQVGIPYLSRATCAAQDPFNIFDDTKICAGGAPTNQGACNGDSGGPLVRQDGNTGRYVQYGVTSYKSDIADCVAEDRPNGYARVSIYCDNFLADNIGSNPCGLP